MDAIWEELAGLEIFFDGIDCDKPYKLGYMQILNLRLFVNSHLKFCKANFGKKAFLPYLIRLKQLKQELRLWTS